MVRVLTEEQAHEQEKKRVEQTLEFNRHNRTGKALIRRWGRELEPVTQDEIDELIRDSANSYSDNMQNLTLTFKDLSGLDLRGAIFHNAVIRHCRFDGADLRNANFTHALIDHCTFKDAKIEGACFWNAYPFHNDYLTTHSVDGIGKNHQRSNAVGRLIYIEQLNEVQGMGVLKTLDEFIEEAEELAVQLDDPQIPAIAAFFKSRKEDYDRDKLPSKIKQTNKF